MSAEQLAEALAGRYTVEREAGAGGMATVYLARDVRHGRKVALKVLRPELGAVLGVERFLGEIRVTANLQHPNLLPLFDSGEANGLLFYVMPFVEGESLRARLQRERQLPVDEAVRIAVAVASALTYAHQHGVIHRDLKPENILLQAGQPVVADFGIALAVSNAGGTRVTQTGLSLGTPQYMSPEQATGDHTIDGRTDTYSLAAVLYEMLTGEPPHTGHSVQAIIARVLTDKPRPVRQVRDTVPAHVDAAIEKALAKLPADRFATPDEFADALRGRGFVAAPAMAGGTARPAGRRAVDAVTRSPLWLAAFVLTLAAALWGWLLRPAAGPELPVRFVLNMPTDVRLDGNVPLPLTISDDGRRVVFTGSMNAGRQLYARNLYELESRPVSELNTGVFPAISPDGQWVAWSRFGTRVAKSPTNGGPSVDLAEVQTFQGAAWLSNTELVVSAAAKGGISSLWRLPAAGGSLQPFTRLDSASREGIQRSPMVVREHGLVIYTSHRLGMLAGRLGVARLDDGSVTILDLSMEKALGFTLGHLVYLRDDGTILAVPFDPKAIRLTGQPVPLLQGIRGDQAALSASGTLVYVQGVSSSDVVSVDDRGNSVALSMPKARYAHPRLSPDGRRLALDVITGATTDIWTYDVASGTPTRLTTANNNDRPEWTADGKRLLYLSAGTADDYSVWWQAADGSTPAEELYRGKNPIREALLLPDNRTLLYREDNPDSARDVLSVSLDRKDSPSPIVATRFDELMPRLSPDGKWLAYQSNESGQYEIYVRPFPGGGARSTVSSGGGTEPLWSRDGRRLFYRNGRSLFAVDFSSAGGFAVTSRQALFTGNYELHAFHPNYDVLPDGNRFIMVKATDQEAQVIVVLNWTGELRQRLGITR